MDRLKFYQKIQLPKEAVAKLIAVQKKIPREIFESFSLRLCDPSDYVSAEQELKKLFYPDTYGMKILSVMLEAAACSKEKYRKLGIPNEIFFATMCGFSRVLEENQNAALGLIFDRSWWMGRLLSLLLFRIGELEYEMTSEHGTHMISIHIPFDADLSHAEESIEKSRSFFRTFFPDYADVTYFCRSWVMSPALPKLLGADSKLLSFWQKFEITEFHPEDESYKWWVFQTHTAELENLSEHTALQRAMKQYLLNGGSVGEAMGILKSKF